MTAPTNPAVPIPSPVPDVVPLDSPARDYAWGSPTAIPEMLGEEPTGAPVAELWIGAHPDSPSRWAGHLERLPLDAVIAADPVGLLGEAAARRFDNRLPFLVKLLAAEKPLSIQAHPDLDQAWAGYAREQALGIPADAPERVYRDENHKPEMICALVPFEALCGFREPEQTARLLRAFDSDELTELAELVAGAADLRLAVEFLLALDSFTARRLVRATEQAAGRYLHQHGADAEFAAEAVWAAQLAATSPHEIGPVVALLMNLVHIPPGNGLFLDAGQVHTYLYGFGVEVLANSDNVVRGGLTPKHVDVAELLRIVDFAPTTPGVVPASRDMPIEAGGRAGGPVRYHVPVSDFELSRFDLMNGEPPQPLPAPSAQLLVVTSGEVVVRGADGSHVVLGSGRGAFIPAGRSVAAAGDGLLWRVTTGPL